MNAKLCVISYNSRGFCANKQNTCNALLNEGIIGDKIPILCNQENFLLKGSCYKINQAIDGFHCFINPAVKQSHDKGRPKNGMFIAVPEILKNKIEDVSPDFWRLQALIIKNLNGSIMLINSYFPVDQRTQTFNEEELLETLEIIRQLIHEKQLYSSSLGWRY